MDQAYVSPELFHFVGRASPDDDSANYATLLRIVRSGWISHPPHDSNWGTQAFNYDPEGTIGNESLLVPTVTCFCDIPEECLGVHMSKYGRFGIGFPRRYLLRYGARPVTYYPRSREHQSSIYGDELLKDISAVVRALSSETDRSTAKGSTRRHYMGHPPKDLPELLDRCWSILGKDVLAFLKPFDADLPDDHPIQFYMEREWRKFGNLQLVPAEVSAVVVAKGYGARFRSECPQYAKVKVRELDDRAA